MSKHVKFPRVSRLRKGYHCSQVDRFHDRVELSLHGGAPPLDTADIRRVGFELVRHGYEVGSVDTYLDQLEEYVFAHASPPGGSRRRSEDTQGDVAFLRDELDKPYMRRFPRARFL